MKAIPLTREKLLAKRILAATDYHTPNDIIISFQVAYPNAEEETHIT